MIKTTAYLEDDLHLRFKILCAKQRISQTKKIVELIEKYVSEEEEKEKKQK